MNKSTETLVNFARGDGSMTINQLLDSLNDMGAGATVVKLESGEQLLGAMAILSGDNARFFVEIADNIDGAETALVDVLKERARVIQQEGFDEEHDDSHAPGKLTEAGASYAAMSVNLLEGHEDAQEYLHTAPPVWPWHDSWWKPSEDPRANLIKAAQLILAEIEKIDRARAASQEGQGDA